MRGIMDEQTERILKLCEAYRKLFDTPDGKKVLSDLEDFGFYHDSTFSGDVSHIAFNEGRRSVVLHIRNMMNTDPKEQLQREG
jgi:hypothetical protein